MVVFKLKPTKKSIPWFKEHDIDVHAMETAITLLFAEFEPSLTVRRKVITIQVIYGGKQSTYTFKTDKIHICDEPYTRVYSTKQKKIEIFKTFLHEFRHWMQSRIYKVGVSEFNYTDEDVEDNTNAYYRNKHEIDARQFERAYITKFCRYYRYVNKKIA